MKRPVVTERTARGALVLLGAALLTAAVALRACERVVAAWSLGPPTRVHPTIRALDAGRR